MNLPPIIGRIIGDASSFNDAMRGAGAQAQSTSQRVGGAMTVVGVSAAGAGAALTAMGEESQQAAAQARIAVENTGASFSEFEGKVDQLGGRMIQLGHDDEAATRAFANLATSLQDPQKALDSMGLVADIAAAKHISLESAADKLAKGMNGNTRVFKEFGITLSANATAEEKSAAMTELAARVQGQAAAQADTFGNKVHVLKEKLANVGEELGTKFGPTIMIAGAAIGGVGQIIQSGLIPKLIAGASAAYTFAVGMVASAYSAVAAAMPIIIAWAPVILTIAAIAAAVYLVWRNWDTIWGFIKGAASAAADWISDNIMKIVAVLFWPVTAMYLLWDNWGAVWDFITGAISTAAGWIGDRISDIVGFFASLPGRAWEAAASLIDKLWDLGTSALGRLKDAILDGLTAAVGFIADLPGRAIAALGNLGSVLFNAGRQLITGFVDGIVSAFGWVKDTLGSLVGKLTSWKGPPAKDAKLLWGAGQLVMGGFIGGLESRYGEVQSSLGGVTGMIGGSTPGLIGSGGGGGTVNVYVTVQGSVTTQQGLIEDVRDGLIDLGRHVPSLFGGHA